MTSITTTLRGTGAPEAQDLPADNRDAVDWELLVNVPTIPSQLGYTPANKAGDTFTGAVTISAGGAVITGNSSVTGTFGVSSTLTVTTGGLTVSSGGASITGNITTADWAGNVIPGQYGGTGVANTGKTITLGGNLTTSGSYAVTLTATGVTNVTLPTTGTLATLAGTEALTGKTINKVTLTEPATSATITPVDGTTTVLSGGTVREALTAARTYYVRTDGSDSNTGLANTAGGAFLTLQKAWDVICSTLDLAGYTATIQIADGTYTAGITSVLGAGGPVNGSVIINGNSGTPANVIVSTTSANAFVFRCPCNVTLTNFEIRTTTGGSCLAALNGASVFLSTGMRFGACAGTHISVSDFGYCVISAAYTVTGGAQLHYNVQRNGVINGSGLTITHSGTFSFSVYYIQATTGGVAQLTSMTYSGGTITGPRYSATLNGIIQTAGGGASYFPGDSAGSTATGGQYA